jgi:hypothetical protein
MLVKPPSVYVKDTGTAKGRGAYAAKPFLDGEIIEACPVVLFTGSFSAIPDEIRKLLFNWGVLANVRDTHALPLGYGSVYNHDNPANMRYEADLAHPLLRFIAVRAIAQDEELTVNYNAIGGGHESDHDVWFKRMNIEPIVGSVD